MEASLAKEVDEGPRTEVTLSIQEEEQVAVIPEDV